MDKYPSFRKCLAVEIILVLIATGIIQSTAQDGEKSSLSTSDGKWLYVGGIGPGNYSKINDAYIDANSGDTIFVYSGTYYELLHLEKTVNLIGEDKDTTSIIFNGKNPVIYIVSPDVVISGFTVYNLFTHFSVPCLVLKISLQGYHIFIRHTNKF